MQRALALAVLLAAIPAHADDCDFSDAAGGTGTTNLAESMDACGGAPDCQRVIPPKPRSQHGRFATGEATVGTIGQARSDGEALSAGELAAAGQAGWKAGPRVCGRTDLVEGNAQRGESSFHIASPWPFFEALSIGYDRQWALRPRLDDGPVYLRRPYSSTRMDLGVGLVTWAEQDGGSSTVFPVRMAITIRDQDRLDAEYQWMRMSVFETRRPHGSVEVLPIELEQVFPKSLNGNDALIVASSWLMRVDAVAFTWRRGDTTLEASGGGVWGSSSLAVPLAGTAAVTWRGWSVRAERGAHLAIDDSVSVEDRLTAGYHEGMWRAGAFAAMTHTSTQPRAQVTGGGSAGVDVALPEEVKLSADVEVARSYYARLDGNPDPTPQLAGIGTVQLTRHFNVNPTAH